MTTIKPRLVFSCSEDWNRMKVGLVSRYCESCKKDVQDFTKLTKEEILHFLLTKRNYQVCGRINKSQLDYHHEELLITIDSYIQKNRNSNLAFYLLAVGAMTLLSCSTNESQSNSQTIDSLSFSLSAQHADFKNESKLKQHSCNSDSILFDELVMLGEVMLIDSTATQDIDSQSIRTFAEVMPEFEGGFDSLYSYFRSKLKYPEWERENKVEGIVFVSFVVNKAGGIDDVKIVKSVDGSKNFDTEVLRLVNEMPIWKPGMERGQNVAVQFTLPIKFKI